MSLSKVCTLKFRNSVQGIKTRYHLFIFIIRFRYLALDIIIPVLILLFGVQAGKCRSLNDMFAVSVASQNMLPTALCPPYGQEAAEQNDICL